MKNESEAMPMHKRMPKEMPQPVKHIGMDHPIMNPSEMPKGMKPGMPKRGSVPAK